MDGNPEDMNRAWDIYALASRAPSDHYSASLMQH